MAVGLLVAAAPAGAQVLDNGGARFGVQPIGGQGATLNDPLDGTSQGVTYHGGPVTHGVTTYAIWWDPGQSFDTSTESLINGFLAASANDSGTDSNIFSVAAQYTDGSGGAAYQQTDGGSFVDTDPYPSSGGCGQTTVGASTCLYDSQEVSELKGFIAAHDLPTGLGALYIVLTPDTVVTCMDGTSQCSNNTYCSFHSYASVGSSDLLYIEIPFTLLTSSGSAKACQDDGNAELQAPNADPGFGDVALKSLSHEMLETITDPLLDAWYDSAGNEVADLCNGITWNPDSFLPDEGGSAADGTLWNQTIDGAHYYLQGAWSNQANGCAMMSALTPSFTVPAGTLAGTPVALSGTPGTSAAVGSYAWNFGDGQSASGQDVSHTWSAPGQYTVTLSVTDSFGNTGSVSEQVDVTAPAGRTAGATGDSSGHHVGNTHCSSVRRIHGSRESRRCTTTTVSTSKQRRCSHHGTRCSAVSETVTKRTVCRETRLAKATEWSQRCSSPRVVSRVSRA